jgi:hypothetical protein
MLTRARLKDAEGAQSEWHSRIIKRYQRRTDATYSWMAGIRACE